MLKENLYIDINDFQDVLVKFFSKLLCNDNKQASFTSNIRYDLRDSVYFELDFNFVKYAIFAKFRNIQNDKDGRVIRAICLPVDAVENDNNFVWKNKILPFHYASQRDILEDMIEQKAVSVKEIDMQIDDDEFEIFICQTNEENNQATLESTHQELEHMQAVEKPKKNNEKQNCELTL